MASGLFENVLHTEKCDSPNTHCHPSGLLPCLLMKAALSCGSNWAAISPTSIEDGQRSSPRNIMFWNIFIPDNGSQTNITLRWPFIVILIIKPTRYTNFSNLFFGMKLYMFRTVPLPIIRSFSLYTHQCYMSYRFYHREVRLLCHSNTTGVLLGHLLVGRYLTTLSVAKMSRCCR